MQGADNFGAPISDSAVWCWTVAHAGTAQRLRDQSALPE
jgi:hypothetical protein